MRTKNPPERGRVSSPLMKRREQTRKPREAVEGAFSLKIKVKSLKLTLFRDHNPPGVGDPLMSRAGCLPERNLCPYAVHMQE